MRGFFNQPWVVTLIKRRRLSKYGIFGKKIVSKHKNRIATLTSIQNKGEMSKIEENVAELYKNMKMYRVCTSMHIEFLQRNSPELLKRVLTYKKKNNGCYCYPENCRGDILIKILNQMVSYVNKYFNSRNISFLEVLTSSNYTVFSLWVNISCVCVS